MAKKLSHLIQKHLGGTKPAKKKKEETEIKVHFEEGCFDELEDELTEEEMDALIKGIFELAETGEILEQSTPLSELPEEEQQEIMEMLDRQQKRTRH